jgi:hypothetical protein
MSESIVYNSGMTEATPYIRIKTEYRMCLNLEANSWPLLKLWTTLLWKTETSPVQMLTIHAFDRICTLAKLKT